MGLRQWYKVVAQLGHQGSGRSSDIGVYVFVRDPVEAMSRCKKMGGFKRHKTPNIRPLNPEESIELEKIISEDGLSLGKAKNKWYTTSEEYKWW